jgi:hypothetical protein
MAGAESATLNLRISLLFHSTSVNFSIHKERDITYPWSPFSLLSVCPFVCCRPVAFRWSALAWETRVDRLLPLPFACPLLLQLQPAWPAGARHEEGRCTERNKELEEAGVWRERDRDATVHARRGGAHRLLVGFGQRETEWHGTTNDRARRKQECNSALEHWFCICAVSCLCPLPRSRPAGGSPMCSRFSALLSPHLLYLLPHTLPRALIELTVRIGVRVVRPFLPSATAA